LHGNCDTGAHAQVGGDAVGQVIGRIDLKKVLAALGVFHQPFLRAMAI